MSSNSGGRANRPSQRTKEEQEKYLKELKKHFPNAVKVIPSGDVKKRPTRVDIGRMMVQSNKECGQRMKTIMPHGKNWLVNFEESYDVSHFYETKLTINEVTCYLVHPFEHDVFATFRVLGVPPNIEEQKIVDHFSRSGVEVMTVTHDTTKFDDYEIYTGNARVRIKTKSTDSKIVNIKTGDCALGCYNVMIIKAGEKLRCRKCNSVGHFARDCKTLCKKCNQVGHVAAQCNMAKSIRQRVINNEVDNNENELGVDDEDTTPAENDGTQINQNQDNENEKNNMDNVNTVDNKRSREEVSFTSSNSSPAKKCLATGNENIDDFN